MKAYPIKFNPILKEKVWGGSKLSTQLHKTPNMSNIGESWEISGVAGNISTIANGLYEGLSLTELQSRYQEELLGSQNYDRFENDFPLLIKYIDANANLSVQVHPDDEMARKYHDSFGKTEMWYVMDHEPGAELILGMSETSDDAGLHNVNVDNVKERFRSHKVAKGDTCFIPAGAIHAIGAGVMVAEIQQTSDHTYRIYDWDRTDANGKGRDLHLNRANEAIKDITPEVKKPFVYDDSGEQQLVSCEYFTTRLLEVRNSFRRNYETLDSFVILMCVEGIATVTVGNYTEIIKKGDTVLIPAVAVDATFYAAKAKLLEVFIENDSSSMMRVAS